jgi:hypothetical protein
MYGLPDAGKCFEKWLVGHLKKHGWLCTPITGVYWKLTRGVVIALLAQYVDDLVIASMTGSALEIVAEVQQFCDCKDPEPLGRFVGTDYVEVPEGIWCCQTEYVLSLKPDPGRLSYQPLPATAFDEVDNTAALIGVDITAYQKLLGEISYVAYCTRPDLAYACSSLARYGKAPTLKMWKHLNGCVRYAQHTANLGVLLRPPKTTSTLVLDMFVDASFGSYLSPKPQSGFVMVVGGCPIAWKSKSQALVARSTYRAELAAMEMGVDQLIAWLTFFTRIWQKVVPVVHSDSANVLFAVKSDVPRPTEKSLLLRIRALGGKVSVVPTCALRDLVSQDGIFVTYVKSAENVTDALTKAMPVTQLAGMMIPPASLKKVCPRIYQAARDFMNGATHPSV